MEILSGVVQKFPLWNAGVFLCFVAVCIWLLTKLDEMTRSHVKSSQHLWEATSTYESEFKKVRSRGHLFLIFCIILNLIWAIVIVCAYALVQ